MTEIILIAAIAANRVIGCQSEIPWRISPDFQRFKRLTLGYPCLMGEATYDSLPDKWRPLPGRENIVLSLDPNCCRAGATVYHDFSQALDYVRNQGVAKAFVIGGASIYRLGLEVADTLELTHLHRAYGGDVLFPEVDWTQWTLVAEEPHTSLDSVSGEQVEYMFSTYRRVKPPGVTGEG
jgi:dihydrofolate reductase